METKMGFHMRNQLLQHCLQMMFRGEPLQRDLIACAEVSRA